MIGPPLRKECCAADSLGGNTSTKATYYPILCFSFRHRIPPPHIPTADVSRPITTPLIGRTLRVFSNRQTIPDPTTYRPQQPHTVLLTPSIPNHHPMSSPTYPNPTVPPPGAWPSRPSLDDSAHRRSIDQRQSPFLHLSQPNSSAHHADSSEGSRRNSMTSGSIHHSPSSLCGSSRHLARFDEQGSLQTAGELPTRGEPGFVGSARLPWITTSAMDSESGPRSAPVASGRLRNSGTGSAPIRSSSSPDPWMNQTSQRSSPSTSPIDHRPNLAAGHGQVYFQGSLVPPYLHGQERRPSPASSLTGGRPLPPRKASDQSTSSQSPSTAAVHLDSVGMSDGQPLLQWPQPRTRKEGGGTICGQCGQTVHGQFVRAMGKVYHLNCFRCKVGFFFFVSNV